MKDEATKNHRRSRPTDVLAMTALRIAGGAFLVAATAMSFGVAMTGCGGDDGGGAQAPVVESIGDQTVVLGSDLLIAVTATDPQGEPVTLSASGLPDNSYFLPDSGIFCLYADYEEQLEQPIQVTFTASDGTNKSSETVTISVVPPDAAALVELHTLSGFTLEPIGNQSVFPGDTLALQLSASGASPIEYRMYPEAAIASQVTLNPTTGQFAFSPTDEQQGEQFEITFQACVPEGTGCRPIVQVHETAYLFVEETRVGGGGPSPCEKTRAAFEDSLPVPIPSPGRYVVQLINESNVTLLAAANAAHRARETPKPVKPREGTWLLPAKGSLIIDIPQEWESTKEAGGLGPVFWARTGCRYDEAHDIAQCETGDCGGHFDCSTAGLTPPGPKSLAEWTFNDDNHQAAPDISVVDGVNINMDIVPVGPHSDTPVRVNAHFWLGSANLPLTNCGGDMRASCPPEFQLKRKQLTFFPVGTDDAEDVVACFSNCGQYKFSGHIAFPGPTPHPAACPAGFRCAGEPPFECTPDLSTQAGRICYYWKPFCDAVKKDDPDMIYNIPCTTAKCTNQNEATCECLAPIRKPFLPVCWDNAGQCRPAAFNKKPNCPPEVCTNQYNESPELQPPFRLCSDLTSAQGARAEDCIGEDTFHQVMPRALTWPNDPQTYFSDAKAFRIIFAPGGTTVPITESGPIRLCSSLPASYHYTEQRAHCAGDINAGAIFAGARPVASCTPVCYGNHAKQCVVDSDCPDRCGYADVCGSFGCDPTVKICNSWECNVSAQSNAVICRWDRGPAPTPTATPGGAPTATPAPLSCDGLSGQRLRLDADRITGLGAGAQVASWSDLSGSGNDVSQPNGNFRPTLQPSTWNGHATVRFGASGPTALTRAASVISGNSPRSIIVVASRTMGGPGQAYVDLGATSAGNGAAYIFSPEHSARFQNGYVTWSLGAPIGTPQVVSLVQSGTDTGSISLYQNGAVQQRSDTLTVALNTSGGTTIGHQTRTDFGNGYWALHGDIGTVLVFDRALSASERCMCEQDLGRKYGVTNLVCD